ncbi:hypothetical protein ACFX2A_031409 [Malus domestica]
MFFGWLGLAGGTQVIRREEAELRSLLVGAKIIRQKKRPRVAALERRRISIWGLLVMGDEKSSSSIVMASRDREP